MKRDRRILLLSCYYYSNVIHAKEMSLWFHIMNSVQPEQTRFKNNIIFHVFCIYMIHNNILALNNEHTRDKRDIAGGYDVRAMVD